MLRLYMCNLNEKEDFSSSPNIFRFIYITRYDWDDLVMDADSYGPADNYNEIYYEDSSETYKTIKFQTSECDSYPNPACTYLHL